MGKYAFASQPEHCLSYRAIQRPPLPKLFGLDAKWDMPVVRHRAVLGPDAFFPGVSHYVLTYHIAGAAVRRTDRPDFPRTARTGSASLQLPGNGGQFTSEAGRSVEYAHFYFQEAFLDDVFRSMRDEGLRKPTDDFFGRVDINWQRDLMVYLDRARDGRCAPGAAEMDTRARLVLFGLLRVVNGVEEDTDSATEAGLPSRQIARVESLIRARLSEKIRLGELAEAVGLSPYHFSRSFKASTGETPSGFVMRLRLERAATLLRESTLTISEIAFQTGFASQSHLSRRIKDSYGVTPAKLRDAR